VGGGFCTVKKEVDNAMNAKVMVLATGRPNRDQNVGRGGGGEKRCAGECRAYEPVRAAWK